MCKPLQIVVDYERPVTVYRLIIGFDFRMRFGTSKLEDICTTDSVAITV